MPRPSDATAGGGAEITGASGVVSHFGSLQGDLILLHVGVKPAGTPTISGVYNIEKLDGTDSDLDLLASGSIGSTEAGSQYVYVGRNYLAADQYTELTLNAPGGGQDMVARMYSVAGAARALTAAGISEEGANVFSTAVGTSASILDQSVTQNGPDRLALQFVFVGANDAPANFTGETGGDWLLQHGYGATTGHLQIVDDTTGANGATIDGGSAAVSVSRDWGVIGLALLPFPGADLPTIQSRVPMPMMAVPDQDRIMRMSSRSGV